MLISILACSLGFHAITFERRTFTKIAILKSSQCGIDPIGIALLHVVAENVVTDRQTDERNDRQVL